MNLIKRKKIVMINLILTPTHIYISNYLLPDDDDDKVSDCEHHPSSFPVSFFQRYYNNMLL